MSVSSESITLVILFLTFFYTYFLEEGVMTLWWWGGADRLAEFLLFVCQLFRHIEILPNIFPRMSTHFFKTLCAFGSDRALHTIGTHRRC